MHHKSKKKAYRFLCFVFSLLFLPPVVDAQILKPVKWSFAVKQSNNKGAELILTAKIQQGFHVYSQDINPDVGPIPTSFTFNPDKKYSLEGKVSEGKPTEVFDENFGVRLKYFSDEVVFVQKIKLNSKEPFNIIGIVTFMVCDDKKCLPPEDIEYTFVLNANGKSGSVQPTLSPNKKKNQP